MKYKTPQYKIEMQLREEGKVVIYSLAHPETKQIFYIGSTQMPFSRRRDHTERFGFKPILEEIETVSMVGLGRVGVSKIEGYWIAQFSEWGFDLANKYFKNPVLQPARKKRISKDVTGIKIRLKAA